MQALEPLESEKLARRDAALLSHAQARMKHRKLIGTILTALDELWSSALSVRHWAGAAEVTAAETEGFLANADTELNDAYRDYRKALELRARHAHRTPGAKPNPVNPVNPV